MASPVPAGIVSHDKALESFATLINKKAELFASPSASNNSPIAPAALQLVTQLFNAALQRERWQVPLYNDMLTVLEDAKPKTRSQKRRKANPPSAVHAPTPLKELFVAGQDLEGADRILWDQMELRHGRLDKLVKRVLGHSETPDEAENLTTAEEEAVDEETADLEDMDDAGATLNSDDESWQEEASSDPELESEFSDSPANESVQPLNYQSSPPGPTPSGSKLVVRLKNAPDASPSKPAPPLKGSRRRSEVDDDFFSLSTFNADTAAAENEMERLMAGGELNEEDEELDVGIDMFAPVLGEPKDTLMDGSEDGQEGGDLDLQDVADVTYADYFGPPTASSSRTPGTSSSKALPEDAADEADEGNSTRRSTVRFAETVRVKNMPARKKKGISVSAQDLDAQLEKMANQLGVRKEDLLVTEEEEWSDEEEHDGMDLDEGDEKDADEEEDGSEMEEDPEDQAISRLKSDLFADDDPDEDQSLSRHEKRQKALAAEIKQLEQENVAKKEWTLSGEARAKDRPLNSLLEQDLEFEHVGKLVPTITAESTQSLEDKIKSRIANSEWDDVERKIEFDPKAFLPSQLLDISATPSGKSLAELYADEYSAERQRAEGKNVTDERDEKLAAKHAELEGIFEGICAKLDALSNTHFTPKAPKTQITTIANTAKVSMESALPATTSNATLLAPEEVYKPSAKVSGADTSDLTPAQKKNLRQKERRAKKSLKQTTVKLAGKAKGSAAEEKEKARQKLIGARGVTVIGKHNDAAALPKGKDARTFKL